MNQIFTNTQIDVALIPKLSEVNFTPISKKYLSLLILNRLLFLVILSIFWMFIIYFVSDQEIKSVVNIIGPILIFLILINSVLVFLGFKKRQYAIRERDIIYSKGLIRHSTTTVPFRRIQHIELKQGFMAKRFDVATLNIFTAGESGGDLSVTGLRTKTAEKINGLLSIKINEFN